MERDWFYFIRKHCIILRVKKLAKFFIKGCVVLHWTKPKGGEELFLRNSKSDCSFVAGTENVLFPSKYKTRIPPCCGSKEIKNKNTYWQIRMRAFLLRTWLPPQQYGMEAEELSFMTSKKYSCRASGGTLIGSLQPPSWDGRAYPLSRHTPTILATPFNT